MQYLATKTHTGNNGGKDVKRLTVTSNSQTHFPFRSNSRLFPLTVSGVAFLLISATTSLADPLSAKPQTVTLAYSKPLSVTQPSVTRQTVSESPGTTPVVKQTAAVVSQPKTNAAPLQARVVTDSRLYYAKDELKTEPTPVGYVDHPLSEQALIRISGSKFQLTDSITIASFWEAGYGKLFQSNPGENRGRNGTAWESPDTFVYLKFKRSF